jgi:hypothetical protein
MWAHVCSVLAQYRGAIHEEFVDPGPRFNPGFSGVELNISY